MLIYINALTGEVTEHKLIAEVWEMCGDKIIVKEVSTLEWIGE